MVSVIDDDLGTEMLAGIGALVGHIWPVFLRFRGGRGAAVAVGVLIVSYPIIALPLGALSLVALYHTRKAMVALFMFLAGLPILTWVGRCLRRLHARRGGLRAGHPGAGGPEPLLFHVSDAPYRRQRVVTPGHPALPSRSPIPFSRIRKCPTSKLLAWIGVNRERDSSRGVTVSLFGGGINPADEIPAGVDGDYIAEFSQAHEQSGFDKVLIGYSSATADGFAVAGYAASRTQTLGYLIAHRAGFMAPTLAARHAATLDQLSGGRIALHVISGGSDEEQRRDGDWLDHDSRYRRTGEWMDIVRRIWTEYEPFDYEGEFYHLEQAHSQVRTKQRPHVPLYFGGAFRSGYGSRRPLRRRVRTVGRAHRRHQGAGRRHPCARCQVRPRHTFQPIRATHPRRHRGAKHGSAPAASWSGFAALWATPSDPTSQHGFSQWGPADCWTSQPRARCTTSACGCP